ncbi:Uncharacterised protein [Vibrio cholerae]|nr:Uncharacterised protein [Vibrio cholerae]CSI35597.1 Uncharacterised protein [Vibrio cholerae]
MSQYGKISFLGNISQTNHSDFHASLVCHQKGFRLTRYANKMKNGCGS